MSNVPVQAVIFDRDGVLTYFDTAAAATFFQPLLPLSIEELARYWDLWVRSSGPPRDDAEETKFWQGFWIQLRNEFSLTPAVYAQLQSFDYTDLIRTYDDVRPALQSARRHDLRTGVLSNFSLASVSASLVAARIDHLIDVAAAAPVIGAAKPAAAAYLRVAGELGVVPEACLFFDDEQPCVDGARAVGMRAYFVDRRRDEHDLAGHVVANLEALASILQQ
jgi:putative hydrolase of the HAD superfamily